MELKQDWRKFHAVFHPSRKFGSGDREQAQKRRSEMIHASPIVAVVERDSSGALRCLVAFGDGMDLQDFAGATVSELQEHHPNRIIHALDRSAVDQSIHRSISQGVSLEESFQDQVDTLRRAAVPVWSAGVPSARKKSSETVPQTVSWDEYAQGHFLLEALKKNAGNGIFPRRFGLLIRLEGRLDSRGTQRASSSRSIASSSDPSLVQDFFVVMSKGRLDQFFVPDLTGLDPHHSEPVATVSRSLAEKYMIPVFGMGVPTPLWNEWIASASPWKLLWSSLRAGRWTFSSDSPAWMIWFAWKRWTG